MVDKGSKISESYKGASTEGTHVDLIGALVLGSNKTRSFSGTVYSKNKTDIGQFDYNNPDGMGMNTMATGSFKQTVTITDAEYVMYQEEAVALMMSAVVEFPKTVEVAK